MGTRKDDDDTSKEVTSPRKIVLQATSILALTEVSDDDDNHVEEKEEEDETVTMSTSALHTDSPVGVPEETIDNQDTKSEKVFHSANKFSKSDYSVKLRQEDNLPTQLADEIEQTTLLRRQGRIQTVNPGAVWVSGIGGNEDLESANLQDDTVSPHEDSIGENSTLHEITPMTEEEIKNEVLNSTVQASNISRDEKNRQKKLLLFALLAILSIIVGVVLAVVFITKAESQILSGPNTTAWNEEKMELYDFLREQSDFLYGDEGSPLLNGSSSRYQAFQWLYSQTMNLNTSVTANSSWLVSNYVLYILYHSLNGPNWNGRYRTPSAWDFVPLNGSETWIGSENPTNFCEYFMNHDVPLSSNQNTFPPLRKCDDEGNLIGLAMDLTVNLKGTIPIELGLLTNLTFLSFHNNLISGTIPSSLALLSNMEYFLFLNNQISGTLPPELASMTNLIEFRVNKNNITGTIPTEYSAMTDLTAFATFDNVITGKLPGSVCRLLDAKRNTEFINIYVDCENWLDCSQSDCSTCNVRQTTCDFLE